MTSQVEQSDDRNSTGLMWCKAEGSQINKELQNTRGMHSVEKYGEISDFSSLMRYLDFSFRHSDEIYDEISGFLLGYLDKIPRFLLGHSDEIYDEISGFLLGYSDKIHGFLLRHSIEKYGEISGFLLRYLDKIPGFLLRNSGKKYGEISRFLLRILGRDT
ncbi:hypothetical protein NL676_008878 [Syzygium grande]|nr:hypothetical protein NL676_008878 [Syzygium grande]